MKKMSLRTFLLATIVSGLGMMTGFALSQNLRPVIRNITAISELSIIPTSPSITAGQNTLENKVLATYENDTNPAPQDIHVGDVFNVEGDAGKIMHYKVLAINKVDNAYGYDNQDVINTVYKFEQYDNIGYILVKGQHQPYLLLIERIVTGLII